MLRPSKTFLCHLTAIRFGNASFFKRRLRSRTDAARLYDTRGVFLRSWVSAG